jgi:hypothetical protein
MPLITHRILTSLVSRTDHHTHDRSTPTTRRTPASATRFDTTRASSESRRHHVGFC